MNIFHRIKLLFKFFLYWTWVAFGLLSATNLCSQNIAPRKEKIVVNDTIAHYITLKLDSLSYQTIANTLKQDDKYVVQENAMVFLKLANRYSGLGYKKQVKTAAYISYFLADTFHLIYEKKEAAYLLGHICFNSKDFDNAEKWTWKALEIYKKQNETEYCLDAYLTITSCQLKKSDVDTSQLIRIFEDALKMSDSDNCKNCEQYYYIRHKYAIFQHLHLKNNAKAIHSYLSLIESLKTAFNGENTKLKLLYFITLIELTQVAGIKDEKIIELFSEAFNFAEKLQIDLINLQLYSALGTYYNKIGYRLNEFDCFNRMIPFYEKGKWRKEWTFMAKNYASFYTGKIEETEKVYASNLLLALIYSTELRKYEEGIAISRAIAPFAQSKKLNYFQFFIDTKLFDIYFLTNKETIAKSHYQKALDIFNNFSPNEQKEHQVVMNDLKLIYDAMYENKLTVKDLRSLAYQYRTREDGGRFALKLLEKVDSIDLKNHNALGLLQNAELKLLCYRDMGSDLEAINTLIRIQDKILNTTVLKQPYFVKAVEDEKKERNTMSLIDRIGRKVLIPSMQLAIITDNVKLLDKNFINHSLTDRSFAVTKGQTNHLFNGEYSTELLVHSVTNGHIYDISEYQNCILAQFALDLMVKKGIKFNNHTSYKGAIFAKLAEMNYRIDKMEACEQYWEKAAQLLINNPPNESDEQQYYNEALKTLDILGNNGSFNTNKQLKQKIQVLKRKLYTNVSESIFTLTEESTPNSQKLAIIDSLSNNLLNDSCLTRSCQETLVYFKLITFAIHLDQNEYEKAIQIGKYLYSKLHEVQNSHQKLYICHQLGILYNNLGNYVMAEKFYLENKEWAYLNGSNAEKSQVHYNLGFVYHHLGNFEQSIDNYRSSIQFSPSKTSDRYANALCQLGFLSVCQKYKVKGGINSNLPILLDSLVKDTTISNAINSIQTAIKIHDQLKSYSHVGTDYKLLADILWLRDLEKAKQAAMESVKYYRMDNSQNQDLSKIINVQFQLSQISQLILLQEKAKNKREEINVMVNNSRSVILGLKELKSKLVNEKDKLDFFYNRSYEQMLINALGVYLIYTSIVTDESIKWEAFSFVQMMKAEILNQELFVQRRVTHTYLAKEFELNQVLSQNIEAIQAENNKAKAFRNVQTMNTLTKNIDSLQSTLQPIQLIINQFRKEQLSAMADSNYYQTVVKEYSRKDSTRCFLDYFMIKNKCYVWKIQKGNISLHTLALDTSMLKDFLSDISSPDSQLDFPFVQSGLQLYEVLIGNLGINFNTLKSLTIIPSGILNYLPFEALISGKSANKITYFIENSFNINYCYSINTSLLLNEPQKVDNTRLTFAGFGKSNFSDMPYRLSNLPSTILEVDQISRLFNQASIYTEQRCTEDSLRKVIANGVDYLHFASHTLNENGIPQIILSPSQKEDGILNYTELYKMEGHVNHVNLSACNTATGKLENIEGIIGLTRAFHRMGAFNIQASLWFVNDQSTHLLSYEYYRRLVKDKITASQALKEAKLMLLNKTISGYNHPYYWAPFISIGKG